MAKRSRLSSSGEIRLDLALQGGGAQGAFTWGVLDRLLDEESIQIGRISGSSAGALNGAALLTGLARGGRAGAKQNLQSLWDQVAMAGSLLTFFLMPFRKPGMGLWDDALPILSPYQTNPTAMAPLRAVLETVVDEGVLRDEGASSLLFVNAVQVRTGQARVFGPKDISIEAILASACAPLTYQAVQIDGEPYWDGSYAANPALGPLYDNNRNSDILLVELTPMLRTELPMSARNILNRINELASIFGLVSELRHLEAARRVSEGADIRMHVLRVSDQPAGQLAIEPSIKRTVDRVLFEMLREDGRRACEAWLASNRTSLGRQSTMELSEYGVAG
jgi:NTE family protein